LFGSAGFANILRNSSPATCDSIACTSDSTATSVESSSSLLAISKSSDASESAESTEEIVSTTPSSSFFSLPSSCAFFGSFQTSGASSSRLTSLSLAFFRSKSKIPP
jgi:hypothetical protein